jgi:4'-phosphopantetheinyl transferase EntD
MSLRDDNLVQTAIEQLAVPGIMIGHRSIAHGDECALMPQEAACFGSSVAKVRRASGAARIAARSLLYQAGYDACAVPKALSGAPVWPSGIVGSLAHDRRVAIAAVARQWDFANIGIDIEPAEPLPDELLELVATPAERARLRADPCGGRLLFVVKEAVYKAVGALDRIFLNHHDVEVDLGACKAVVRKGRTVDVRFCVSTHLMALAYVPHAHPL